jgi:hypothetical protein
VVLDDRNPVVLRFILGVAELDQQTGFRNPRARRPENALKDVTARGDQETGFANAARWRLTTCLKQNDRLLDGPEGMRLAAS